MKILIVSDTHGKLRNFDAVLEQEKQVDMLLHLGDVDHDDDYMEAVLDCPVHIIAGNNDFFSGLPHEEMLQIGKYQVFMTHGHNYYVSAHTRRLKEAARSRGADIVMYGHTHKPDIDTSEDVIAINPGSLSYPRQGGGRATYIIMEVSDDGDAEFTLKYV